MRSEELILQAHQGENAPAALAMILTHYGVGVSMGELSARRLESAADLVSAARSYGLYAQGYRMSCRELYQAPLPLIAHWRFREFVVVTAVHGKRISVSSPSEGRLILSRAEFEAGFTGVALCFSSVARRDKTVREQVRPFFMLRAFPSLAALLAAMELFLCVCCVLFVLLLRFFAGRMTASAQDSGGALCAMMGLLLLLQIGTCAAQLCALRRCAARLGRQTERDFADRLDRENAAFFIRSSRYRLELIGSGCSAVPAAMAREVFYLLHLVTAAVCIALMTTQDGFAAAAVAAEAAVFSALCVCRRDELYNETKLAARDRSQLCGQLDEDAHSWEKLRLSGKTRTRFANWLRHSGGAVRLCGRLRMGGIWSGFAAIGFLTVFFICLLRTVSGAAGIPALLSCVYLTGALTASMAALPRLLEENSGIRSALEEAGNVFQGPAPEAERQAGTRAELIALQNGSVRYGSGAEEIIKGVTFQVQPGELLVVQCGQADGRRALSRVLAGLELPGQGMMYFGSRRADELGEDEIYANIALLGNGLPAPSGTVRENISAGSREMTDYAVVEAASAVTLHQSILLRRKGYDAPVSSLSDGERVLLEFACAFARGTPFLVASDITDRLDRATVHDLMQAMRRRRIGAVLLTGEEDLLREADQICRIEEGRMTFLEQAEFMDWEVHSVV